jgi:hypothetical protein
MTRALITPVHGTSSPLTRRSLLTATAALATTWALPVAAQAFDPRHAAWTTLLQRHVVLSPNRTASQLRYAGMARDRAALGAYLTQLSAVTRPVFDRFSHAEQMAFLINAYNAFTVELVLTRYPDLSSIKDLGRLLQSPWKKKFVPLLGSALSLDGIEHDLLRAPGRYDDPRIHFAVNCASVGCPMLREEAYVASTLDVQLDAQTLRFMSDRSRNRWNAQAGRLEVSKIFDWYGQDFELGHRGITSRKAFYASHADQLADTPRERERLRQADVKVSYLDYDWALNDAKP